MHFLVTNDDGIHASGLEALVKGLLSFGKVTVVAPNRERSATSHSLTLENPLRAKKIDFFGGVDAFSVNGTPADCVKLGVCKLVSEPPDYVIAGMNSGSNMSVDVFYSGTVAGALEGLFLGIPAVAFSLATKSNDIDFFESVPWIEATMKEVLNFPPTEGTIYNINVPAIDSSKIVGWKVTSLGKIRYDESYELRQDPAGMPYYWLTGIKRILEDDPETDIIAVQNGYISITPIRPEFTDLSGLAILSEKFRPMFPEGK